MKSCLLQCLICAPDNFTFRDFDAHKKVNEVNQMHTDSELYHEYLNGNAGAGDQLMLRYDNALTLYIDSFIHNLQDAEA